MYIIMNTYLQIYKAILCIPYSMFQSITKPSRTCSSVCFSIGVGARR